MSELFVAGSAGPPPIPPPGLGDAWDGSVWIDSLTGEIHEYADGVAHLVGNMDAPEALDPEMRIRVGIDPRPDAPEAQIIP